MKTIANMVVQRYTKSVENNLFAQKKSEGQRRFFTYGQKHILDDTSLKT